MPMSRPSAAKRRRRYLHNHHLKSRRRMLGRSRRRFPHALVKRLLGL